MWWRRGWKFEINLRSCLLLLQWLLTAAVMENTLSRIGISDCGEREGWNLEMQNNAEMAAAAAAAEGHTHGYFLMADLMISGKTIGKLETEGAWNMLNSFRCFCCSLFLPSKLLLSFHRLFLLEVFLSPHLVTTT